MSAKAARMKRLVSDPVVEVPLDHLVIERPGVFEVGAPGLLWERELVEPFKELKLVPSPDVGVLWSVLRSSASTAIHCKA